MSRPFDPNQDNDESEEFIEDLKSIKDLLDEEEASTDVDVPLLDDQIDATVEERLGDDTFSTLLGDAWRDSVEEMFADARADGEANSTAWLPEDTDELADALKIRIDPSVKAWLAETLQANIHLLRERIVTELSAELIDHLRDKIGDPQEKN